MNTNTRDEAIIDPLAGCQILDPAPGPQRWLTVLASDATTLTVNDHDCESWTVAYADYQPSEGTIAVPSDWQEGDPTTPDPADPWWWVSTKVRSHEATAKRAQ